MTARFYQFPCLLLMAFLVTPVLGMHIVHAATYYVATNGSDAGPGTQQAPFRSLGKAARVVKPGDTVLVKSGSYQENVQLRRSGTASAPITFKPEPGSTVTLATALKSQSDKAVFFLRDVSFNRIEGFHFKNFRYGSAIRIVSSNRRHDVKPHKTQGNVIKGNRFENIGTSYKPGKSYVDSIIKMNYSGPDNIVEENYFTDNYGYNIKCYGCFRSTIKDNTITRVKSKRVNWSKADHTSGIWFGGEDKKIKGDTSGRHNMISGNRVFSFLRPNRKHYYYGIWCDVNGDHNTVQGNSVHHTGGIGIFIESRCDHNLIQDNASCENASGGFATTKVAAYANNNQWINNVAYENGLYGFRLDKSNGNILKQNISFNNKGKDLEITSKSSGNQLINNVIGPRRQRTKG